MMGDVELIELGIELDGARRIIRHHLQDVAIANLFPFFRHDGLDSDYPSRSPMNAESMVVTLNGRSMNPWDRQGGALNRCMDCLSHVVSSYFGTSS